MSASNIHATDDTTRPVLARRRLALYEDETRELLVLACEWADHQEEKKQKLYERNIGDNSIPVLPKEKSVGKNLLNENCNYSSDSESSTIFDEDGSQSSTGDSDECNGNETIADRNVSSMPSVPIDLMDKSYIDADNIPKLSGKLQKRLMQDINRHSDNLIRIDISLHPSHTDDKSKVNDETESASFHLFSAAALLPKIAIREPINTRNQAYAVRELSEQLSSTSNDNAVVIVLLIQSGRFAGGVFRYGKCLAHRATARYTIRKGQGKAQSTQDGSRRPKSVGSQLRRAGEEQLKVDIKTTLQKWNHMGHIDSACLIFLACPKTMRSTVFSTAESQGTKMKSKINVSNEFLSKDDDRIRKIPFDIGRATFHNVEVVYKVLMSVDLCHVHSCVHSGKANEADKRRDMFATTKTEIQDVEYDPDEEKRKRKEEFSLDLPMTSLHIASRDGKLDILMDLLSNLKREEYDGGGEMDVDRPAGYDCMTPLHFAAAASTKGDPITASALVSALLIQAHADPTILDAKRRPPYFLAGHEKVREAFRKARAILGEEYCDWDRGAKVGPPLTEDDLEAKREKEAEKKRRKKARQKEKKAKAKAAAEEAEKQRIADEKSKQLIVEAKRLRDGLSAKPTGANVCDFCHKICKGRNAAKNMFRRLDYKYCGTECVNKHKRELMAAAALARFG